MELLCVAKPGSLGTQPILIHSGLCKNLCSLPGKWLSSLVSELFWNGLFFLAPPRCVKWPLCLSAIENLHLQLKDSWLLFLGFQCLASGFMEGYALQSYWQYSPSAKRPLTSYLLDLPSNSLNSASKSKAHLFFKVLSHRLAVTALVLAKQIWLPQCHTGHAHGVNWRTSQSLAFTMLDHLAIVMMTWRFRQTHLFTQAYKTEGNSSWDYNTDKLELSKWLSNGPSKRPFHFLSKAKTQHVTFADPIQSNKGNQKCRTTNLINIFSWCHFSNPRALNTS